MAYNTMTEGTKILIDRKVEEKGIQLYEWFFAKYSNFAQASITVDEYTGNPYALETIENGEVSKVRQFENGSGYQYSPKISSAKTPIDQDLDDSALAGLKVDAPDSQRAAMVLDKIVNGKRGFYPGNVMQRNKACTDVLTLGKFVQRNSDGYAVGETLDFDRDSGLEFTYNFTAGGATVDIALKEMYDALKGNGMNMTNLSVLLGSDWITKIESDSTILARIQAYQNTGDIQMKVEEVAKVDGLYVIGKYVPKGMLNAVTMYGYQPSYDYRIGASGAAESYLGSREAVMFTPDSENYRFDLGVLIPVNGKNIKQSGDLLVSSFSQEDPPVTWIVAKNRFAFIHTAINHTSYNYATFV